MSIQVKLSYEELILNALARVKHPKGERDVISRGAREWAAIRAVLAPLYEERRALADRVRALEAAAQYLLRQAEFARNGAGEHSPFERLFWCEEKARAALRSGAPSEEGAK